LQGAYLDAICNYPCCSAFDTINAQNGIFNYPNPFSTQTTIAFRLKENGPISIYITSLLGKRLCTVINNVPYTKGGHTLLYNGADIANGNYICVLETQTTRKTFKMTKIQ
jgi:hypothetical protein